jgi:cytosine/adenosine deaminase-related metal-dependent hydrolase
MTDLLIDNARLVTWNDPNELLDDSALLLRDGLIHDLGPAAALGPRYPDAERLDAGNQLVMPGNICAHTHFYGAFARGMAIPGAPPKDFPDILERLWWRLDRALFDLDTQYSALVCLVDAIKHGTTTLVDHHASPSAINNSLDMIADAVETAGVRAALCYEVTDRNGPEEAEAGIGENVRFLHSLKERNSELLAGTFGLHAALSLSDETLANCVAAAPTWTLASTSTSPSTRWMSTIRSSNTANASCPAWPKRAFWGQKALSPTRTRRCRGEKHPARNGHLGNPPAAQQHEQRRRRGRHRRDAAAGHSGLPGQ